MAKLKDGSTIHLGVQKWSEIITVPDIQELAKEYLDGADFKYTKGTFTPFLIAQSTAGSYTYGAQRGQYVTIGDLVFFTLYCYITAIKTQPVGIVNIAGLPFNTKSTNTVNVGRIAGLKYDTARMTTGIVSSTSDYKNRIYLYDSNPEGMFWNVNGGDIQSNFSVVISGFYLK